MDVLLELAIGGITYAYGSAQLVDEALVQRDAAADGRHERDSLTVVVVSASLAGADALRDLPAGRIRARVRAGDDDVLNGSTTRTRIATSRLYDDGTRDWSVEVTEDAVDVFVERLEAVPVYDAAGAAEAAGGAPIIGTYIGQDANARTGVEWYDAQTLLLSTIGVASDANASAPITIERDHAWFEACFAYDAGSGAACYTLDGRIGLTYLPVQDDDFDSAKPHAYCPRLNGRELLDLTQTLSRYVLSVRYGGFPSDALTVSFLPSMWPMVEPQTQDVTGLAVEPDVSAEEPDEPDLALVLSGPIRSGQIAVLNGEEFRVPGVEASYATDPSNEQLTRERAGSPWTPTNATRIEVDVQHPARYLNLRSEQLTDGDFVQTVSYGDPRLEEEERLYLSAIDLFNGSAVAHRRVDSPAQGAALYVNESWAVQLWPRLARQWQARAVVELEIGADELTAPIELMQPASGLTFEGTAYEVISLEHNRDEQQLRLELSRPLGEVARFSGVPTKQPPFLVAIIAEQPEGSGSFVLKAFPQNMYRARTVTQFEMEQSEDQGGTWTAYVHDYPRASATDHMLVRARSEYSDGTKSSWTVASTDPAA